MKLFVTLISLCYLATACPDDRMCTACLDRLKTKSACKTCTPWSFRDINTGECELIPEGDLYQNCVSYRESASSTYRCSKCEPGYGIVGFEKYPCGKCMIEGCTACEWKDGVELCNECSVGKSPASTRKACEPKEPCGPKCERCAFVENAFVCQQCTNGFARDLSDNMCQETKLENCLIKNADLCVECASTAFLDHNFKCIAVLSPYRNSRMYRLFSNILLAVILIAAAAYLCWRLKRNQTKLEEDLYTRVENPEKKPGQIRADPEEGPARTGN